MKQKKLEQFGWNRIDFFMKQSWFKLKWLKTRRKRGDFTEPMEFFSNYWEIINQTLLQKTWKWGKCEIIESILTQQRQVKMKQWEKQD